MATLKVQAGHLIVQRRNEQTRWRFEDILWLEARGHRTKLHARDGAHLIAAGLAAFVHWLPRDRFQRLNRSIIVNHHHMKAASSGVRGRMELVMSDGTKLTGSRNGHP